VIVAAERDGVGEATGRRRARELAVQWLYQSEVGGLAPAELRETFWPQVEEVGEAPLSAGVRAYAERLTAGVTAHQPGLDARIEAAGAVWRLARMNIVDRLVLRVAVYELVHETDLPAAVVINEAIELARTFSTEDSVRFVNGVLDAVRRRGVEG
jgi:N utilization substance protein B